jgi:hypothetical protein
VGSSAVGKGEFSEADAIVARRQFRGETVVHAKNLVVPRQIGDVADGQFVLFSDQDKHEEVPPTQTRVSILDTVSESRTPFGCDLTTPIFTPILAARFTSRTRSTRRSRCFVTLSA